MKKYIVESVEDQLALVEESTGHIIDYFDDRREARYKGKWMSSGGAFNGFTPRFICRDHYSNWFEPEFTVESATGQAHRDETQVGDRTVEESVDSAFLDYLTTDQS